jgi:hypothetical protein
MWEFIKQYAKACADAGMPLAVKVTEYVPSKTRDQEKKYHAQLGDIAKQCKFMGRTESDETWKRLLIHAFAEFKLEEGDPLPGYGRIVPSLSGRGVVQLGAQSRKFSIKHGSEFIEHLYAYGAENNVEWSEPRTEEII